VGVGDGGDADDLRFKVQGLKYLEKYAQVGQVYGIPIELLQLAIRSMKVSAAADIDLLMEFRGTGYEEGRAIAYIKSAIYRDPTEDNGFLAINAARLFVTYAPEQLGLTDGPSLVSNLQNSRTIKRPYLLIPGKNGIPINWRNPNLTDKMSKKEKEAALKAESERYMGLITDPKYQFAISKDEGFIVVRLRDQN
jgi:hypothetical protein